MSCQRAGRAGWNPPSHGTFGTVDPFILRNSYRSKLEMDCPTTGQPITLEPSPFPPYETDEMEFDCPGCGGHHVVKVFRQR